MPRSSRHCCRAATCAPASCLRLTLPHSEPRSSGGWLFQGTCMAPGSACHGSRAGVLHQSGFGLRKAADFLELLLSGHGSTPVSRCDWVDCTDQRSTARWGSARQQVGECLERDSALQHVVTLAACSRWHRQWWVLDHEGFRTAAQPGPSVPDEDMRQQEQQRYPTTPATAQCFSCRACWQGEPKERTQSWLCAPLFRQITLV